jgi:hypothetical protein
MDNILITIDREFGSGGGRYRGKTRGAICQVGEGWASRPTIASGFAKRFPSIVVIEAVAFFP